MELSHNSKTFKRKERKVLNKWNLFFAFFAKKNLRLCVKETCDFALKKL